MGKLYAGINGPFSGKVGSVVGYLWNGKAVMRGLPSKINTAPTEKQLAQRAKFALMRKFLIQILELLNITFGNVAIQMTGFSKGFSYNLKNALNGTYPDLAINYSMVSLGRGDLPNIASAEVASNEPGRVQFTWTDNSGLGQALASDKAFVAIYSPEISIWKYALNAADRNSGSCTIDLVGFNGKPAHTYIGFIAANGKDVTDTLYTGLVNVM
jgi:hypothetical protein